MSECTHDCSSCGQSCASRTAPQDLHEKLNDMSSVKKVIAVVSGKGGVGKSLVTSAMAVELNRRGHKTAVIDFDVGLRNLDLIMGCERRVVYDLVNVVQG